MWSGPEHRGLKGPRYESSPIRLVNVGLLEDGADDFLDAALNVGVIGQGPHDADLTGAAGGDALLDELAGVDEEAGADALAETVLAQVAHLFPQLGEVVGGLGRDAALVLDDLRLELLARVGELQRDEALARAVLEVFEGALVAGVVRDDEEEALARLHELAALLDGEHAAVVGEGVDEDRGVLSGLDDLIEVADGAGLHGAGERAIDPAGGLALEQVAADEIAGGEVFVARDGDEREGLDRAGVLRGGLALVLYDRERTAQFPGHVLDEAGLAAAGRALEQDGDVGFERGLEELDLVGLGDVVGLAVRGVFLDGVDAVAAVGLGLLHGGHVPVLPVLHPGGGPELVLRCFGGDGHVTTRKPRYRAGFSARAAVAPSGCGGHQVVPFGVNSCTQIVEGAGVFDDDAGALDALVVGELGGDAGVCLLGREAVSGDDAFAGEVGRDDDDPYLVGEGDPVRLDEDGGLEHDDGRAFRADLREALVHRALHPGPDDAFEASALGGVAEDLAAEHLPVD